MKDIEFDPTTNLPRLPDGYRWRVGKTEGHGREEYVYAVFLEKEHVSYRWHWFSHKETTTYVVVRTGRMTNSSRRYTPSRLPMVLTAEIIRNTAIDMYREWERVHSNMIELEDLKRKSAQAEREFFGTYPPKSL